MTKSFTSSYAHVAVAALLAISFCQARAQVGCGSRGAIKITSNPQDQLVYMGEPASFKVVAKKAPLSYQWMFQGTNILGATTSEYTVHHVTTNDVGFYTCMLSKPPDFLATEPVSLMAFVTNGGITIYSTPPPGGPVNPSGQCPKPNVGCVSFYKTTAPFGWKPIAGTSPSAQHANSSLTDVKYFSGTTIAGCGNNGFVSVTQIDPSKAYRFTVFYPSANFSSVPSSTQTIILHGFNP